MQEGGRTEGVQHLFGTKYKVLRKTVILVWQKGRGSEKAQICVASFLNDPQDRTQSRVYY